jgi:hypothetical protein
MTTPPSERAYGARTCGPSRDAPHTPIEIPDRLAKTRTWKDDRPLRPACQSEDAPFRPWQQGNPNPDDRCGTGKGIARTVGRYRAPTPLWPAPCPACLQLGIEPLVVTYVGPDPAARVTSLNLRRRHLTASQLAMAAAKMATMRSGARTDLGHWRVRGLDRARRRSAQGRDNEREAGPHRLARRHAGAGRRRGGWEHPGQACGQDRAAAGRAAAQGGAGTDRDREARADGRSPGGNRSAGSRRPEIRAHLGKPFAPPKRARSAISAISMRCCWSSASKSSRFIAARARSCGSGSRRKSRSALSRWIGALRSSRSGMMTSGKDYRPRSLISTAS